MNDIDPNSADWYYCPKCKESFLVRRDDPHRHLTKSGMRCPNHMACDGYLAKKKISSKIHTIDAARWVTALELYQAAAGAGLPEERNCSVKELTKLLTGAQIKKVQLVESLDKARAILLSITVENGKTIHLTTSTKGPVVYKVTNERR